MNASKETAEDARESLWCAARLLDDLTDDKDARDRVKVHLIRVENFLETAKAKLPSEAAYERDRLRRTRKATANK